MTKENWWIGAKIFLGLPLLFYALLSVLEPQREIWRKPTKKVLVGFLVAWGIVFCFIALALAWNAYRQSRTSPATENINLARQKLARLCSEMHLKEIVDFTTEDTENTEAESKEEGIIT